VRILHVIARYWPGLGGAEMHLAEISARLAAEGHQVTVATTDALDFQTLSDPRRRRVAVLDEQHDGVRILRFPLRHLPACPRGYAAWRYLLRFLSASAVTPVAGLAWLSRFTPWVPGLWQWARTNRDEFDLVGGMSILFEPVVAAGLSMARRRQVPFIIYPLTHLGVGSLPGNDHLSSFYTMRHQLSLVRASQAVLAQTDTERAFYEGKGVPGERISVVGPGVDPAKVLGGDGQRFRRKHGIEGPLVVSLASLDYSKGTISLVEAVRQVRAGGRRVALALAGTMMESFRVYWEGLAEEDRQGVQVLGSVNEEEKRDLLAACDVFAVPSRTDSFGIVYLEAWLYGKPVIGAQAWGIQDVIHDGRDGRLAPFGDAAALAAVIADLLDHPETRASLGASGRQEVYARHTWEHKYAQVREIYTALVQAPQPPTSASR
jgi:glycogen synthase